MDPARPRAVNRGQLHFEARSHYRCHGRNRMIIVIAATRLEVEDHSHECTITLDEGNADCTAPVNIR